MALQDASIKWLVADYSVVSILFWRSLVVVFGGVQSLIGTALSGFAIAQSQTWLEYLMSGSMAKATILLLVIAVLYVRPNGLFATRSRS